MEFIRGGVCDGNYNFIAGLTRNKNRVINYSCNSSYAITEAVDYVDEEVIFGGVFINHFGHLMVECLSRLWYMIENRDDKRRIVILTIPEQKPFLQDFFKILGIEAERFEVVNKPVRYKKIIVPEETIFLWSGFYKQYISIYDAIKQKLKNADTPSKLYLTRTKLGKKDSVNEEFFENFFSQRGYTVVSTEQLSVEKQIELIANAKSVVCTEGTLSHFVLFANCDAEFVILRRTETDILLPQIIINQAKNMPNITYIDVTYNLLPSKHSGGVSLYGPTKFFIQWLDDKHISYSEGELNFSVREYCYDYLVYWCSNYSKQKKFNDIYGMDLYDVLNSMEKVIFDKELDSKKYKSKSKQENELLKEKIKEQEKKINELSAKIQEYEDIKPKKKDSIRMYIKRKFSV